MAMNDYYPIRRAFDPVQPRVSHRLGRWLEDMFADPFDYWSPASRMLAEFSPKVNVTENDTQVIVRAEIPGIKEEDLELNLSNGGLLLKGEKREEHQEEGRAQCSECSYGAFERYIPIDADIKQDQVSADFTRGVLTVTLPKSDAARKTSKKIEIRSEKPAQPSKEKKPSPSAG